MSRSLMRLLVSLNLVAFLGTIVANGLANALPINGRSTGQISDSLPNLFVPAGLTFSIWGLIYLLLGVWAIWQMAGVFSGNEAWILATERVSWLFIVSSAANIGWILAWHYGRYVTSLILMLVLLASLIVIYLRLGIGEEGSAIGRSGPWAARIPFSLYLGWITVATVANVTALLVHIGWSGFGIPENIWAIVVIAVAAVITMVILWTRGDNVYSLVVLWAFLGIYLARTRGSNPDGTVATATVVAGLSVVLAMVFTIVRQFRN